jgi:carbon storage regulator
MLVLSRKVGEKVVVPEYGLTLTVLAVQGRRVRLGISAPADAAVHREEVWRRQQAPAEGPAPLG